MHWNAIPYKPRRPPQVRRIVKKTRLLVFTVLLIAVTACAGIMSAKGEDRNVLWEIVSHCLDTSKPNYREDCKWPIAGNESTCLNTTEVWARSNDYVAIRDRKMCGCPSVFVHGLALPLQEVIGVEAKNRPAGIWDFAWDVAKKRITEAEIALVVNPLTCRNQDQLHVHIVKLNGKGHKIVKSDRAASVETLEQV
jgi:CDP-diacylglycerol pyrophosphatase